VQRNAGVVKVLYNKEQSIFHVVQQDNLIKNSSSSFLKLFFTEHPRIFRREEYSLRKFNCCYHYFVCFLPFLIQVGQHT
jgi:hypothetical protein